MSDATSLVKQAEGTADAALPMVIERNERRTRTRLIPKLLRLAGRIPFAEDLAAAWYCTQDSSTPNHVRGVLLAALAYFVMPADLIPDVILSFGFSDDATVLATAIGLVGSHIKPKHHRRARRLLRLPEPAIEDEA